MKNNKLKITLILSVFSLTLLLIVSIFIFGSQDNEKEYNIDETQAKALEIENTKITNISDITNKKDVTTKIKNKSKEIVSNIKINYVEFDKNQNKLSTKKIPVEVSLKNEEKALISIVPESYTYTIDIVGYSYETKDYGVNVDLNEDEVAINEVDKKQQINKSEEVKEESNYKILDISDLKKIDDTGYKLTIVNLSQKNLGNIILKVAEVNEDDEYVSVNNISCNSTLKAKQSTKIFLNSSDKNNTLEIIGYTYDDIENKNNIDVDLKSDDASIVKN